MENTDTKPCPFCEHLKEMKLSDAYYIEKRDGRTGETKCEYKAALVHETYYNGSFCGCTTYNAESLNYCPVCGNKIEE